MQAPIPRSLLMLFLSAVMISPSALTNVHADLLDEANLWRSERRLIDLHQHVNPTPEHLERAITLMDRVGIGISVNLSGGTTVPSLGTISPFEHNKKLADELYPGRFVHYMNLDYADWNEPDFAEKAVHQIEEGHRLGAAGLKEYKRLGLYLKDKNDQLIKIDDPKLDPVWKRCGELGMPVSIHVADPKAFWAPYDESNERWTELKDHPTWWFGDSEKYPSREALLEARNRVVARHPGTTFVCVHFANNPEDIEWVDQVLDAHPNMKVDLAARIPELGRHDPARVRAIFEKHQDRILFATDFMVYDRLILGSGGDGPSPTDEDAVSFFEKHWLWLETDTRDFDHMTPIQGDWTIDGIALPAAVLRKIYFDNAQQLLVRSLPRPTLMAKRISEDFEIDGKIGNPAWQEAPIARIDHGIERGNAHPQLSTAARVLWSDRYLYIAYDAPFQELTTFEPPRGADEADRFGLWERDVVEAFIGTNPENINEYTEFQVAPTGETLDLILNLPEKDFDWKSHFQGAVRLDQENKRWTTEMRIPLAALSANKPVSGETTWRLALYRHSAHEKAFLGWAPTASGTAHVPERYGYLKF